MALPAGARRLLAAQVAGSFGLAAGGAGALLAADLTGSDAAGALPVGALALGAAGLAPALTGIMARRSRRHGLVAGYVAAAAGAVAVLVAAGIGQLLLILVGSFLLGAGNDAVMLTRYAVADLVPPASRGRALSRSLLASAAGAVAGPNLLGPAAALASALGLPPAAGLYVVAIAAFGGAAALLGSGTAAPRPNTPKVTAPPVLGRGRGRVALVVLATANATMVSVMSLAAVHLQAHGHGLSVIGVAVSLHVLGMFAGSPVVGRLCDRLGPVPVALAGTGMLATTGVVGMVGDASGLMHMAGALLVLGVGWNVQMVAGSTLLTISVPDGDRLAMEGRGELVMGLAAGLGTVAGAAPLAALGGFRLLSAATVVASAASAYQLRRPRALVPNGHRH